MKPTQTTFKMPCQGKTLKGIQCKKTARPGSSYCSIHATSRWDASFFKNRLTHILTIFGLLVGCMSYYFGATKKNQEELKSGQAFLKSGQASILDTVERSNTKFVEPKFNEKLPALTINLGSNKHGFLMDDLQSYPAFPIQLRGSPGRPMWFYTKGNELLVDWTMVYSKAGKPLIALSKNSLTGDELPPKWDLNKDSNGIEVVNEFGMVVFQLDFTSPNYAVISGFTKIKGDFTDYYGPDGIKLEPEIGPDEPIIIPKLFRYPSSRYPGQRL